MANGVLLPPGAQHDNTFNVQVQKEEWRVQPFPFLCLKPCFAPAPLFLKPGLAFWPLDLNDLSLFLFPPNVLFPSNLFFPPNFFSLSPAFFAPNVFPPGLGFFPNGFSSSLDCFHPFPPGPFLLSGLASLSFLGGWPEDIFLLLALGNMSAQKKKKKVFVSN